MDTIIGIVMLIGIISILTQGVAYVTGLSIAWSFALLSACVTVPLAVYLQKSSTEDKLESYKKIEAERSKLEQEMQQKIFEAEAAEKQAAEAEMAARKIRDEKISHRIDGHLENIVNSIRAIEKNESNSILLSTIDSELQCLIAEDVMKVLLNNNAFKKKLLLAFDVMKEKEVSDRFVDSTISEITAKLEAKNIFDSPRLLSHRAANTNK